ncbi:MAG TPA: aminotransferase class I/II-fold pyridoxal phosphate-dependent enzyme [Candidatus Elarobacter sp.]
MTLETASRLSARVRAIPEALSIWMNQIVYDLRRRGTDVTVLSLGEAYFEIPWFGFDDVDAARANHYSDSRGLPELRERIAAFQRRAYGAAVDPSSELLITAGSKLALYLAMLALLDPGDEVIVHEPAWLSYPEHVRLAGGVPHFVPYDVPLAELPRRFTARTRLVVLNNPNNPAGSVYSADELLALHRSCRERGVELLVDEAYSDFVVDGSFRSLAALVPGLDGAIVVNSLSKNLGISGWRIGYLIARPDLVDACLKLNQHIVTCAPTVLQLYLARHFEELVAITIPQARAVAEKRARVAAELDRLGLRSLRGAATFYFFVALGDYRGTSMDFATALLLEDGIAVVPGSAYGESTDRYVRLSIGTESEERIAAALATIRARISEPHDAAVTTQQRLHAHGFRPFTAAAP